MTQDPNADDLLPCPFCATRPIPHGDSGLSIIHPQSGQCPLEAEIFFLSDWNRRALKGEATEPTNPNSLAPDSPAFSEMKSYMSSTPPNSSNSSNSSGDEHDEYCFIAGGGGGMCNCSARLDPVAPGIVGEGKEGPTLPPALEEESALERLRDIRYYLANIPPVMVSHATQHAINLIDNHISDIVRRPAARSAPKGTDLPAPGIREAIEKTFRTGYQVGYQDCEDGAKADSLDAWKDSEAELAALHPQPRLMSCLWSGDEEGDFWETECGHAWQFNDGGPKDNDQKYCGFCGNEIDESPHERDDEPQEPRTEEKE